jgi:Uma2 family endonuclease
MRVAAAANVAIEELHRYSLDSYHRLIEAGGFGEGEHVELLEGLLVRMSPKTPRHVRAILLLARWLFDGVDDATHEVGVGRPLTLSDSEPEPDLTVVERGTPTPYHPATAALVIEVAVSSLRRDLGIKTALYGSADVLEYWVLDLDGRRMLVHRAPHASGYAERHELAPGDRLQAVSVALAELDLGELLRAIAD